MWDVGAMWCSLYCNLLISQQHHSLFSAAAVRARRLLTYRRCTFTYTYPGRTPQGTSTSTHTTLEAPLPNISYRSSNARAPSALRQPRPETSARVASPSVLPNLPVLPSLLRLAAFTIQPHGAQPCLTPQPCPMSLSHASHCPRSACTGMSALLSSCSPVRGEVSWSSSHLAMCSRS